MTNDELSKQIITYIKRKNSKYATYKDLTSMFKNKEINNVLKYLSMTGEIYYKNDKFYLNNSNIYTGKILVDRKGIKEIITEDGNSYPLSKDTYSKFIHGDEVQYRIVFDEVHPFKLINRPNNIQVFEVVSNNGNKQLQYTNGIYNLNVPSIALKDYLIGEYLLVDISNNTFNGIIKRISNTSDVPMRERVIAYNYGFDDEYSEKYLKELSEIPTEVSPEETINRKDYRNETTFTIDCDNTKDMDDAISIKILPNGNYELTVHIASVSEYVKFNGEIFKTAMKRGNSLYTQRCVFPMIHYIISNGICSLNPNVDRLTKSFTMEFDKEGKLIRKELNYGVINSNIKMKYSEVEKFFTDIDNINPEYLPYKKEIYLIKELSDLLGKNLKNQGKIELESDDWELIKDENNQEKAIKQKYPISRKIIENFMLYTGWKWAELLEENNLPIIYRVEEMINIQKLLTAVNKINKLGFDTSKFENSFNINDILKPYKNNPVEYSIISNILLSAFKPAFYSHLNIAHFGTGLPIYGQVTSDIRRGGDLYNHYSSDIYLSGDASNLQGLNIMREKLCAHLSEQERNAEKAEREAFTLDLLDIAKNNIGNTLMGYIAEIKNGFIYVRLNNGVFGILDNPDYDLIVGDFIDAKIEKVNYNSKTITLSFQKLIKTKNHQQKVKKRIRK